MSILKEMSRVVTSHAVHRIKERFQKVLSELDINLDNDRSVRFAIHKLIESGKESKSHLNNLNFMEIMYEKYGYDTRFHFVVSSGINFVIVEREGEAVVVTCYEESIIKNPRNYSKGKKSKFTKKWIKKDAIWK